MVKVKLSQCYRGGVRKKGDTDPFNHSSTGVRSVVSLIQEYCKAQIHRCFGLGRHWSQSAWVKIHFTLCFLTDSLKSLLKRRQLADFKSSLMAFPSLATLRRIQTDLFECSTCFSFVWEVKQGNENDKGGGVRKIVFSFDLGSAFVRLYTLLFETQTKKLLATQSTHTIGIIWL